MAMIHEPAGAGWRPGDEEASVRRVEWTLLALLLLLGSVARLARLGELPLGAPETEEGTTWLATAGQLAHGVPLLPSGLAYWKGWPYTLLAAACSRLFGLSAFSLRLPAALAGIAAIALAWWAARSALRLVGVRPALAAGASLGAAYVLSLSAWSVLMSRNARFYELGLALFIAGAGAAVQGFAREDAGRTKWVVLFGILAVVSSATLHVGGLLLVAPAAAAAMGFRPRRAETIALGACLLAVAAWFAGVLFVWKTGHVEAGTGGGDVAAAIGPSFWKTILILAPGVWGWTALARAERSGRGARRAGLVLVVLSSLLIAVPVFGGAGPLRSFRVLAGGHPGLVLLAAAGLVALAVVAARLPRGNGPAPESGAARPGPGSSPPARGPSVARLAMGLVWILAVIPAGLVGASTAHFVPRYLLFALGPLTVAAVVGLAVALDALPRAVPRWAGVAALAAVPFAVLPSVGPVAATEAALLQAGERVPPLFAASPSRPYAMDVAGPSKWVAARLHGGDLVVATNRSIPHAVIGRLDFWYSRLHPSNIYSDGGSRPRNLITGCPVLHEPAELLPLCAEHRVWVIVDPQSEAFEEVVALETWLAGRVRRPVLPPLPGRAQVFLLPRGCGE